MPTNHYAPAHGSDQAAESTFGASRSRSFREWATKHSEALLGYSFVGPALLVVGAVMIYPILFNINIALRQWDWSTPFDAPKPYVGLTNFTNLVGSDRFVNSLKVSLELMVFALIVEYLLGLGLALLLNKQFRGRRIFRTIFILPMVLAPIIVGIQWRYLLSGNFGVVNYILFRLGIEAPALLSDPTYGLPVLVMVDSWMYVPFVSLILLAGLQQIPQEVQEAAEVDGAGAWARFIHITFPLLGSSTAMVLMLRSTEVFRAFDVVYVLTGGGPERSTEVLGILLYRIAFGEGNFGSAAALAIIISVIGMVIGGVFLKIVHSETRLF
ncbi:MAG TPA: sugar ABC transporter permease [Aggregatilinea sp.]|uniref:carbohydrate ABC transporter permease n=1 Tax=Aggregatilinea sp. TaxID=2806333 RepID=UPI002BEC3816|nr:sugar ABC transporter permease [Aggregatilinea sp.]HML23868.1 sugar ABC transporter permease [Aggregatilinea sp.]